MEAFDLAADHSSVNCWFWASSASGALHILSRLSCQLMSEEVGSLLALVFPSNKLFKMLPYLITNT